MKIYEPINMILFNEDLSDVKTKWHPKEGLFLQKGESIAKYLLDHSNSKAQAVRRINFYINRGGEGLPNKTEVMKAKRIIENSIEKS